jgi:hypothetical protein
MIGKRALFMKGAVLLGGMLLAAPTLAGDRVHSPTPPRATAQAAPAPAPVVRGRYQPVSISLVTPAAAPQGQQVAPRTVRLRGPDGEVRSYQVEGGPEAIQYVRPVVLRSGQSITITFVTRR